jgi:hypothetical protein
MSDAVREAVLAALPGRRSDVAKVSVPPLA